MPVRLAFACLLAISLFLLPVTGQPPGADEWKYDVVHRKQGQPLKGLVIEQTPQAVRIRCISRKPGRPTVVFTEWVPSHEVSRLDLLPAEPRKQLAERLETLKRERSILMAHLRLLDPGKKGPPPADALDLVSTPWPGNAKLEALGYRSTHFHLISTARAEVVQMAAIHLEQIYAAYARCLPPRADRATPTTILLTRSLDEYEDIATSRRLKLSNPAFYDPGKSQVVCGSNLERLGDELAATRAYHAKLRATLKERRAELLKVYRNKVPAELLSPLAEAEQRIIASEKRNDEAFARVQQRLFQRLYHEAFHAYLGTFVYPAAEGALPVWFNEGLAQIFESAIVEVGELRVGHANADRVKAVRQALARDTLLPLADLLRADAEQFRIGHAGDRQASTRHYLASWALAFHLTFGRNLLGTKALDDYVFALKRGTDPLLAFRDLVGIPLDRFEKEHRDYLKKLRPPEGS